MKKEVLKNIGIYAGILLLFVVLAYSFTPQVLEGKIVNQSDIASWKGMANEAVTHNAAHPDDPTDHCKRQQRRGKSGERKDRHHRGQAPTA